MSTRGKALTALLLLLSVGAAGCTSGGTTRTGSAHPVASSVSVPPPKFFSQAEFDRQMAERRIAPQGDPNTPWLQMIQPTMVDTSKYVKHGKLHLCLSNAGIGNPWRVTGLATIQAEAKLHPEIGEFTVLDADSKDDKQIADLANLQTKGCNAVIVSPNTTETLTPAIQKVCASGIPVIVFDRGVLTDCPVTFIHPIGGYAFGADAAEFVALKAGPGGKVLAIRLLPDVDVLENRWSAAKIIFDREGVDIVGMEFSNADAAKSKQIVAEYLRRYGHLDGVWLDAGATSVAVAQAFQEAGQPVPPLTSEDQQDFLALWQKEKLTAIAVTYPVYQWRTAVIAALDILSGKPVPKEWILPQPVISSDNLSEYLTPGMPDAFYSTCGCQNMPGFPRDWGGK
jgi:ribose transport system substrate-binding protein